ncbi:SymE family type I addiction module toxin [Paraburkholderia madseniana]
MIQGRRKKEACMPFHLRKEPPAFPWTKLSGRWIENAGFEPGQRVRITVEHQRLIITPT